MSWSVPPPPELPAQPDPPRLRFDPAPAHAVPGADVVALPVLPGAETGVLLGPGGDEAGVALGLDLLDLLDLYGATGAVGEVFSHPLPGGVPGSPDLRWLMLVGVGAATRDDVRRAGAAVARASVGRSSVASSIHLVAPDALEPFAVGVVLGSFRFRWSGQSPIAGPAPDVVLAGTVEAADPAALARAEALALAGWRARTLATVPSNVKNPAWLADQATALAAEAGLEVRIWDEEQLATDGFGGILAVGRASATPPRLIRLDYPGLPTGPRADRRTPTVVLVGKGITFDSGGLSIKPAAGMVTMKRDMTGGAVVLATMAALADVGCPVRVVGLIAAAENAVSGSATRPGDVVTHWGGRTTEVTNTDAEGRVVLADALAYAVAELDPAAIVDIATLTGAVKVALGQQVGGFFATDEGLVEVLTRAAAESGEPLWRLPLSDLYEEKLASKVADADNAPGGPGSITAALFLRHFVGDVPWAHLDVASVGDAPAESYEWTEGPTGFGARALLAWLGTDDPLSGVGG